MWTSYSDVFNHLLETYATNDVITQMEDEFIIYTAVKHDDKGAIICSG